MMMQVQEILFMARIETLQQKVVCAVCYLPNYFPRCHFSVQKHAVPYVWKKGIGGCFL